MSGGVRLALSLLLVGSSLLGCASKGEVEQEVEVEVKDVAFDRASGSPVLILEDKSHEGRLPMFIGTFEAQAIAMQLRKVATPRPLTHDLITNILRRMGAGMERVLISDLKNNTYYARIFLLNSDRELVEIDSRPSDAIALALRFGKPIYVVKRLLTAFHEPAEGAEIYRSEKLLGAALQDLSPELAAYFGVEAGRGVLVSDAVGGELRRGDLILALNGKEVKGLGDLRRKLAVIHEGERMELEVERDGERIVVRAGGRD